MIKYKNFDELRNNPLFMVPMINDEIFSQIFANPDLIDYSLSSRCTFV